MPLILPKYIGPGRLSYGQTELIHVIRRCGLTSGLKLCLDAGDAASYSSGQSWLDTSGNGYGFFRGATVGSEASDPTFNGTAGQRAATNYWSFDGGDYFRYDSANEAWMDNIHKDGAKFTFVIAFYSPSFVAGDALIATLGNSGANTGFQFRTFATSQLILSVYSNGADLELASGELGLATNAWHLLGVSVDENAGASGGFFWADASQAGSSFNPNYAAPSAGTATYKMEIGAFGNAVAPLSNLSRIGMVAAWEGVALTVKQLNALYRGTRGRFGV